MKFKELRWEDHMSEDVIVGSTCIVKVYSFISIEFRISYERKFDLYYLYTFGRGKLKRLQPDTCDSMEEAKTKAYKIYNDEMCRIKKAVDYLLNT